jgi:secretion system chaperone SscA
MKSLSSASETLLHQLAVASYDQGNYEKATGFFRFLTLSQPHDSRYWFGLGSSLLLSGNVDEALQPFQIASIYNDKDPKPFAYKAECLARLGRLEEAHELFDTAYTLCKEHGPESFLDSISTLRQPYESY